MSRTALTLAIAAAVALVPAADGIAGVNPHTDSTQVSGGCASCHKGHGVSSSPMLRAPQHEVCLGCHDSQARRDRAVKDGDLSPSARPQLLSSTLSQPYTHPIDTRAFSRDEGAVTCTSCHAPHRGSARTLRGSAIPGTRRPSPRNPAENESDLCLDCHGRQGPSIGDPADIRGLTDLRNLSYHPVQGPSKGSSPSVSPSLAGKEINCTDCHGNSDPSGPRGPHGSSVRGILLDDYVAADGSDESPAVYALCYRCHEDEAVLNSTSFPGHRLHVEGQKTSCATCHNPHGALDNRALIRFGEPVPPSGVSPSISAGSLSFVSISPGEGTCYLTCHGRDHAPESYGPGADAATKAADATGGKKGKGTAMTAPSRARIKKRPKPPD